MHINKSKISDSKWRSAIHEIIFKAVNAPRVHYQWLPDETRIEEDISPNTINILKEMGHPVSVKRTMGAASSILKDNKNGSYYGASDPKRKGLALGY